MKSTVQPRPDVPEITAASRLYRWMHHVLRAGVTASLALFVAGLALWLITGAEPPPLGASLDSLVAGARRPGPASLVGLGVLVLLATPVARVLLGLLIFTLDGDRRWALLSATVLALLGIGAAVALALH